MTDGGRGHGLGYIFGWDYGRAPPWHFDMGGCRGWGQRLYGCMQEQEETKFERAGELKVAREMRGSAER